jgi:D-alanyl-D-alanine carboxypeptidase
MKRTASILTAAIGFFMTMTLTSDAVLAGALPGDTFQAIIDKAAASGAPGVVARVETADGESWTGAAGVTSIGGEDVTPASIFRLFSITKTIVAATAFTLIDEGRIGLDDPIARWLDASLIGDLPHHEALTVRHLIAQTSGVRDYDDDRFVAMIREDMSHTWKPEELVAHAADGEAFAPPGNAHSYYSNTNYTLLGLIIERVSGMPLVEAVHARVLEPLGAAHTFFWEETDRPQTVAGYYAEDGGLLDVSALNPSLIWAAGNVVSTAEDAARLIRGILAGSLLSAESRALMTEDFRPLNERTIEYGYGTFRAPQWTPAPIGHSGEGPGGDAIAMLWPDDGTVVVVLTNLENGAHLTAFGEIAAALGK